MLSAPLEHVAANRVRVDCGMRWSPRVRLFDELRVGVQRGVDAATARLAHVHKQQRRRRRLQAAVPAKLRPPARQPRFRVMPPTLA